MPIKGLANLSRELNTFTKGKVPMEIARVKKTVAIEVLRRAMLKTPVDTGRARGGWGITLASSDSTSGKLDKSGNATLAEGVSKIKQSFPNASIYISNNVAYIQILEAGIRVGGDGRRTGSFQAPQGMLAITVDEVLDLFQGAVRRIA